MPHVRAGRLRSLAVTSAQRTSQLPDTPTMIEAGGPGFIVTQWLGAVAPAGTSQAIVELLQHDLAFGIVAQAFVGERLQWPKARSG